MQFIEKSPKIIQRDTLREVAEKFKWNSRKLIQRRKNKGKMNKGKMQRIFTKEIF